MKPSKLFPLALVLTLLASMTGGAGGAPLAGPCLPGAAYDPACDADHDGDVDIFDIQLTAGHWNQSGAYVSDNNHNHLGQTWTGSNNPLKIEGSFAVVPDHVALAGRNTAQNSIGVRGEANASGSVGVWGQSTANTGVYGLSTNGAGVWGQSTGGVGVRAESTNNAGLYVAAAGTDGVIVNSAGSDGVHVSHAGSPSAQTPDSLNNGFEVEGAQGHGLYVGRADADGVYVSSAGGYGVVVSSAGGDGVVVSSASFNGVYVGSTGSNGVWVSSAGSDGVVVYSAGSRGVLVDQAGDIGVWVRSAAYDGVHANTTQANHEWGFSTPDKIFAGTALASNGPLLLVAQSGDSNPLETGDLVVVSGTGTTLGESESPLPLVRRASPGDNSVMGVVYRRFVAEEKVEETTRDGQVERHARLHTHSAEGPVAPGDTLLVVVLGPAQVKVDGATPIAAGQPLTVATNGRARPLGTIKVQLAGDVGTADLPEGAPVIGVAMGAVLYGLVWVLVNPQ